MAFTSYFVHFCRRARELASSISQESDDVVGKAKQHPFMFTEESRFETFHPFECSRINVKRLAKNGFYYGGVDENMMCAFCSKVTPIWDDSAQDVHQPCPLAEFPLSCGNVPDTKSSPETSTLSGVFLKKFHVPLRPRFASLEARLLSFKEKEEKSVSGDGWNGTMDRSRSRGLATFFEMAQAGFFKDPLTDRTTCFFCGLDFFGFCPRGEARDKHRRYSMNCPFLKEDRGLSAKELQFYQETKMPTKPLQWVRENKASVCGESSIRDDEDRACCVCSDAPREVLLLPCRHLIMCRNCCECLSKCPVCRTSILIFIKVHGVP